MQARIIIVANRLPVSAHQTSHGIQFLPSPGGLAAALRGVVGSSQTMWLGYLGASVPVEKNLYAYGLPKNAVPLHIPSDEYADFYAGVSNGSLWPVFHSFKPRRMYSQKQWQQFLRVTERFADKLCEVLKPNDVVWIHDYQLCMLPNILKKRGIGNKIGYFLHIPFPEIDFFRMLPNYKEILKSLVQADVCGLQTRRDVLRLREALRAESMRSKAAIESFPVGIDYELYARANKKPAVRKHVQNIKKHFSGKTIIFSISRLDYTKGIEQQLQAVDTLLSLAKNPENIVYQLTVAPSRENLNEYEDTRKRIEQKVAEVNAKWRRANWQPVQYAYRNFPFEEVAAWYAQADVLLVTPLQDGMNLIAKEYIAARPEDTGVLVLSNNAGAAEQMKHALLCDPHDTNAIAEALHTALTLTEAQRSKAARALRAIVREHNAKAWAQNFLHTLDVQVDL